ncbi:MAG: hypothetical protein CMJ84_11290 [Planctomycetes bacterium]|jgi:hypothetical protein|nr:hypothetical protein [Planctomycetota bacterium]MDP6409259.1 hypothetical protein [Planctomycetota bacterium]
MAPRPPRSLIIVSRDYGELGLACSLLHGQRLAREATLLLPGSLYFENERNLPVNAYPYSKARDIREVVAATRPELVFLLSGYLLSNDGLLSPGAVEELVEHLEESGATLLTSDPFLGMAANLDLGQVDMEMLVARYPRWYRPLLRLLLRIRSRGGVELCAVPALRRLIHLYPTAVPRAEGLPEARRLSVFNPIPVLPAGNRGDERLAGEGEAHGGEATPPRWLFLLSSADLHGQSVQTGLLDFLDLLVARLADAVELGRRPSVIGSQRLAELLAGRVPDEVELVSTCSFADFTQRLLEAEFAFYWNAFSHSVLLRVANGLPVFLFDRGHLAQTVAPFQAAALACHFAGIGLPELDQREPLDADDLAQRASAAAGDLRAILAHWLASPTPDELGALLQAERAEA